MYRKEKKGTKDIPLVELDSNLCHFFMTVRRHDGQEYEPDTLLSLHRSIDRHLTKDLGKTYSVLHDKEFVKSWETLKAASKQLKRIGKGNRPNSAESLSE